MIEIFGALSAVIAIVGVIANNRRRRWCFALWLVSNFISAAIHMQAGIWSLFVRDLVFFILVAEGYFLWGKKS